MIKGDGNSFSILYGMPSIDGYEKGKEGLPAPHIP
jgi:hypothetical protein